MSFLKTIAANFKALSLTPESFEAVQDRQTSLYTRLGWRPSEPAIRAAFQRGQAASYGWMYSNQPAVRTVVDYIATNVAQLPLKCYERVDDDERVRREDHPAARTMAYPDEYETGTEFVRRFIKDYLVYDNAFAVKLMGPDNQRVLLRLPPAVVTVTGARFRVDFYRVYLRDGSFQDIPPEGMIHWRGYNPDDSLLGLSKLETLRRELAGDLATQETVLELLRNGLKGGYIKRPLEADEWSQEAQQRFQEGWKNQAKGLTTPVLADGMEFINTAITPKDAELLSSREFTEREVLRLYVGPFVEDETVQEQRKQVYTDVLPPIYKELASRLDRDLLQAEYGESEMYFEFDANEKLRGDIETRFGAITSAAGRPWLTVNEVRSMEGKPPISGPDGDALTIPLNVSLAGEQGNPTAPQLPAPNVMPPQDPNKPPQDGSYREGQSLNGNGHHPEKLPAILHGFYDRQERVLKSRANGDFDIARWNRELKQDLSPVAEPEVIDALAEEINGVTEIVLAEAPSVEQGFERLRDEAAQWAHDIDRARVLLVAQGLADASSGG